MEHLQDVLYTFTLSFGRSRTGKTVVVTTLDNAGAVAATGRTIASVIEIGGGFYGVAITFTDVTALSDGYIKAEIVADSLEVYIPFTVLADYIADITTIRKVMTNRWRITGNQLLEYDDNGTSVIKTFDLKKASVANDGTDPDERDPV